MSDLHVVASVQAKPGSEEVVRNGFPPLEVASRNEEGCVSYQIFESTTVDRTFVVVERYKSPEAFDAHLQTPHFKAWMETFGEHLTGAPVVHILKAISEST
ncbi:putative quinol monooxygenase [Rhodococcus spongiicola]|uniref:Antibiotic biosynthesis monooxygenase n=1 Tax=Rhodococcus spongiicola TaxID=2487352 RepID=A0A3S3ARK9_9NOCA|nr:putative quinol monooxygenase [Rhodococcus spongiicola]RVW06788.1 antibiotic biosynthesis monooxygenase [Rhodococcus spongiicola]